MSLHRLSKTEHTFWANEMVHNTRNHVLVAFLTSKQTRLALLREALRILIKQSPRLHSLIVEQEGTAYWQPIEPDDSVITLADYQDGDTEQEIAAFAQTSFRLSEEPPCKFRLLSGSHQHLLLFLFHHIVMDDSSMQVFCARLSHLYNELSEGRQLSAIIPHFYEDTDSRSEEEKREDIAYWNHYVDHIKTEEIRSYFPATFASQSISTHRFSLDDLQDRLHTFCSQQHIGPFRLLSAAWAITVAKVFDICHVNINYPVSLRPVDAGDELGVFVSDQLLHVNIGEKTRFIDVVNAITQDRREARLHQNVSLLDTRMASLFRDSTNTIAFNYPLGLEHVSLLLGDEHIPLYQRPLTYMPSALQLDVESSMSYAYIYANDTFPSFFPKVLAGIFKLLLQQTLGHADILLDDLCLSTQLPQLDDNVMPLLHENESLVSWWNKTVCQYADNTAIIFQHERVSFALLDQWADQVATAILQATGEQRSSHFVGVYTPRSIHTMAMLIGVWKAGYAFIPMDPQYSLERINHIVSDSQMAFVVTDIDTPPLAAKTIKIEWGSDAVSPVQVVMTGPPSPYAYMIYTSGTTGQPKGTPVSQHSLINLIEVRQKLFPLTEHHVELCFGSISFDASIWDTFPPLFYGATVCLASEEERRDPNELIKVFLDEQITCALLPPTVLTFLPYMPLPHLKYLMTGGDICPKEVIERWQQTTTVYNAYGPTENTVVATVHPFTDEMVCPRNIGQPLPNVQCYVLDDQLHLVPDGVKGTLYIGGAQLTGGYWNRPELNAGLFSPSPFVAGTYIYNSGDGVVRMPNGDILFLGRRDSQVKVRGFRIELSEIETTLLLHPAVDECAVLVCGEGAGKTLAAYVAAHDTMLTVSQLKKFLKERLPVYMLPEDWHITHQLPINTSGKIDREQLLLLPLTKGGSAVYHEKLTEQEIKCLSLLSKVMNRPDLQIGVDDDLISEIGINSLTILELSFLLSQRGYEVRATDIYQHRTIRKLAVFLHNLTETALALTPEQIDARICFFATPLRPDKPLILIICGYRYYEVNYSDLHNCLKDDYNILVIESVIELKAYRPDAAVDALAAIDEYVRILRPIISRYPLAGITGLCIGGDLALQLAVRLHEQSLGTPWVFNIDGMANRPDYQGQMGVVKGLGISSEEDARRKDFTIRFAKTIPQHYYPGPSVLFLATCFEDIGDFSKEQASTFYPINLKNWQQAQPSQHLVFLDDVHMQLIHHPLTLKTIKQTIDKSLLDCLK